ncbi:2459_t:CDS:2, partial [Dentiscutata erythropus]
NSTSAKDVKNTFGLGSQGSKRSPSPPKLTDPKESLTLAKMQQKGLL